MGEGHNTLFLGEKGWQITGVGIFPEPVKQAKARAAAAHVAIAAIRLSAFDKLKVIHYEDVVDKADWAPGKKSRVIRFIAKRR